MALNFNIIGAGRLGKAIAQALIASGQAQLNAVCNASFSKAKLAVEQIGFGTAVHSIADLPAADLTFITTPDDLIPQLAMLLAKDKILAPQSIVAHCSGVLSTTALAPLKVLGCHLASVHPLRAFKAGNLDNSIFQGCDCVIEGDDEALNLISDLFRHLGARIIPIKQENKTVYHSAAVIASNYLVTLAATAIQLFNEAGIPASLAKQMTTNLMTSSLNNIENCEHPAAALTGPLQRGDINTITKHLDVLPASIKALYTSAALATLPLTTLSDEMKMRIKDLLEGIRT
jgi:predicted short-subunit dehydrogenase-like oxidoreductase (DUF2520 family)